MAEVFIRRTTAILLVFIAMLTLGFVALLVIRVVPEEEPYSDKKFPPWSVEKFKESQRYETSDVLDQIISKKTTKTKMMEASATTTSSERNSAMEPWEKNIRIPETTIPVHYDLMLFPNLETGTFTGKVATTIGVTEPIGYLVTHIKYMNITSTKLQDASGREVELLESFEFEPNQFWVVRPKVALKVGNYTLYLDFNGGLKGHIVGFYMSEYTTLSGEKRAIATSKFQPTDARRAFPCFDEPSFKSTFKTTLIRPSQEYIALSNMPVEKETPDSPSLGYTKVEFEKSVPMVTYLACFIVCDFEHVEVLTNETKPFRVYATKDQIDRAHYARDIGVDILNYYEKYFEVEYPLPKQDMIAIPDFVSGAMEHWGLITYRETSLLYDNVNSSSYNKQRVASVVAHELAHMWFGNLVTLKWWDDLWLNEGFASYIEYKGVAHHEKDWDMMEQFAIDEVQSVFSLDEILSSHPIVQPVNHPDEITEIFDAISYSKGASVLRMLENFIGSENFRMGVRNFLRRFKYGNAVTQDLWDDMQATLKENLNVTRIMDTWTRQMGFPVVNVKVSANNQNQIEVTQERFLIDSDAISRNDSPYQYKWDIPITYKTESVPRNQVWMKMEQNKLLISRPSESSWIKFNVDQYGYYRVNYDAKLWQQLIQLMKSNHEALSPSDRSSLIDDAFSLAAAKHLSYETAFQVASYMKTEKHYVPWSSALSHLTDIGQLLQFTKAYASYRKFVAGLVADHVDRVGWDDIGSHTERRNRILILKMACSYGHKRCVEGAVQKFTSWIKEPSFHIPANFRSIVYKYGIKETGEDEWNELFERFLAELNAQEKITMLAGLTSSKEPWIINRFLDMAKNESVIRQQDFFTILNYFSANPSALPHVWNFVRENWQWMVDKFGLNNRYLGQMVRNVAYKFTVPLQLTELQDFFAKYPKAGAGRRSREQALERVQQNIKWIENFSKTLHMWLLGDTKV